MITIAFRWTWCILSATAYQVLTNPYFTAFVSLAVAGVSRLLGGYWQKFVLFAGAYLAFYFALSLAAVLFAVRRPSRIYPELEILTAPKWLHILGNEQEGYDSPFAKSLHPTWKPFIRRFVWAAWRNKTSNVRFILWLHPAPEPERIGFIQGRNWWICWQGWAHNWQWVRSKSWTEIGWRYEPKDAQGVAETDWRQYGCGVAFRLRGKS
jgi:hypothetical protein